MDFFADDALHFLERREMFQCTGADNPVLHPTVGTLDLALGLWRKGINHVGVHQRQHLAPLGIHVIRPQDMLAPHAIPVLDETEDA